MSLLTWGHTWRLLPHPALPLLGAQLRSWFPLIDEGKSHLQTSPPATAHAPAHPQPERGPHPFPGAGRPRGQRPELFPAPLPPCPPPHPVTPLCRRQTLAQLVTPTVVTVPSPGQDPPPATRAHLRLPLPETPRKERQRPPCPPRPAPVQCDARAQVPVRPTDRWKGLVKPGTGPPSPSCWFPAWGDERSRGSFQKPL